MAIKMDGHTITSLKLTASDGSTTTKALTEDGVITTPTATKDITENGTNIDVLNYAKVNVNVPTGGGESSGGGSVSTLDECFELVSSTIHTEDWTNDALGNAKNVAETYVPNYNNPDYTLYIISFYPPDGVYSNYGGKTMMASFGVEYTYRNSASNQGSIAGFAESRSFWIKPNTRVNVYKSK